MSILGIGTSNVNIVGIGNLDAWATEETLAEIRDILRDSTKKEQTHNKKQEELLKKLVGEEDENTDEIVDAIEHSSDKVKAGMAESIKNMMSYVTNNPLLAGMAVAVAELAAVASVIYTVTNKFHQVIAPVGEMHKKGLIIQESLSSGIVAGTDAWLKGLVELNISTEDFMGALTKHTSATTQIGIPAFKELALKMKSTGLELGFTTKEMADYTANYIEQQRLVSNLGDVKSDSFQQGMLKNLNVVTKWSQVLGISTKQMQDQVTKQAEDMAMRRAILNVDAKSKEAYKVSMAGFEESAPALANAVKSLVGTGHGQERSSQAYKDALALDTTGKLPAALLRYAEGVKHGTINSTNIRQEELKLLKAYSDAATGEMQNRSAYIEQSTERQTSSQIDAAIQSEAVYNQMLDNTKKSGSDLAMNEQANNNAVFEAFEQRVKNIGDQLSASLVQGDTETALLMEGFAAENVKKANEIFGDTMLGYGGKVGQGLMHPGELMEKAADTMYQGAILFKDSVINSINGFITKLSAGDVSKMDETEARYRLGEAEERGLKMADDGSGDISPYYRALLDKLDNEAAKRGELKLQNNQGVTDTVFDSINTKQLETLQTMQKKTDIAIKDKERELQIAKDLLSKEKTEKGKHTLEKLISEIQEQTKFFKHQALLEKERADKAQAATVASVAAQKKVEVAVKNNSSVPKGSGHGSPSRL